MSFRWKHAVSPWDHLISMWPEAQFRTSTFVTPHQDKIGRGTSTPWVCQARGEELSDSPNTVTSLRCLPEQHSRPLQASGFSIYKSKAEGDQRFPNVVWRDS